MTYGFVGLGQIGRPIAKRIPGVVVFDVREEATKGFDDIASSLADLAERCDLVSVMVRDDEQVRDVVGELRRDGLIVAIHSTIRPGTAEDLARTKAADGVTIVDAPVSGGAIGAADGTLAVMVGGSDDVIDRLREAFAPWSNRFVHAGPVGAGTKMKLARNLITFTSFAAASEAQMLAEAAGLDLVELGHIVRHSDGVTGGPGAIMFRATAAAVASDDPWFDVLSHTRDLGEKDLSLALELAEQLGLDLPVTSVALHRLAHGLGVPHD